MRKMRKGGGRREKEEIEVQEKEIEWKTKK